jgi:nitroreductase
MDFKDVIDKRYSCRNYSNKKISKKLLLEFLKDASKAPSGSNSQPWFYCIVNSKKNVDYIKGLIRGYFFNKDIFNYKKESKEFRDLANSFYYNLGDC